ncbi:MAG: RHS repeat-associated core domain-containing protein, partial [bacterium]|nr:RHS repeat-associated core domain-containing protein [Candidatus Colisoma equi]
ADGTTVNYTYTADGLPEQTTRSNGHWVRNIYDAARQVVGVETDDGDGVTFVRDPFGRETSAANAVATYGYALDISDVATNETAAIGGATSTIRRVVDASGRRIALDADGAEQFIGYRADGKIGTVSNADAVVTYAYTEDGKDAGHALVVSGGATFTRTVARDPFRRELVTRVENGIGTDFSYGFDALGRPVSRNDDSFAYNAHGEVSGAWTAGNVEAYAYDDIGNAISATFNLSTNLYVANAVNEYVGIESDGMEVTTAYDAEGNLTQYGEWSYTYDAQNRLATVSSNGLLVASNFYDHMGRRVRMVTSEASYTFIYDGWNLVLELAERGGETERTEYYWGKDISGTLQGAGGIGGLLYLKRNGTIFVPIYDAYGNVMEYRTADGSLVASYAYDAFGRTIAQSGSLADTFRHRHATKFFESETGFYYYGHRHYVPSLARWLTTDPIEEDGGLNLYAFCGNNAISRWDALGESCFGDCFEEWSLDWKGLLSALGDLLYPVAKTSAEMRGFGPKADRSKMTTFISKAGAKFVAVSKGIRVTHPVVSKTLFSFGKSLRWLTWPLGKIGLGYPAAVISTYEITYDLGVSLYCADYCGRCCYGWDSTIPY